MTDTVPAYDPPLLGVRVLDLASGPMRAVSGHLADLGAQVTRVDLPGVTSDQGFGPVAEGIALGSALAGRGARRVAADRSTVAGREAWHRLLAESDILIEDTIPGGRAEAALGADAIRREYPALVLLSVSDFGRGNDFSDWQATPPVFHALTSELSRSGIPGREPLIPPGDLPYEVAAAQAAFEVVSLYLDRLRTGAGNHIDFSVLDGAMAALDPPHGLMGSASEGEPGRGRPEARHRYPIIACADGYVRICVLATRQWHGLFEWMGRPAEFADPSYEDLATRFRSPDLLPAVGRFFARQTRADLEQLGQQHGVPVAAVLTPSEALASEQVRARGFFREAELTPGLSGPVPAGVMEIDGARACRDDVPLVAEPQTARLPVPAPREHGAAGDDGRLPLRGIRVLDLGVIVVGGDTSRILADLGADVIKIENPAFPDGNRAAQGLDGMTESFAAGHRNKRSIGLNLRDPDGRQLARDLVRQADIVLTNFKPGVASSLGMDYDSLKEVNPGIVVVDSSAFGPTGPSARRLGYGPLVRAATGCTYLWAYPGEPGGFADAITIYPDHVCARIGGLGALALLIRRRRTARGGAVSVAQSEVMLSHFAPGITALALTDRGRAADTVPPRDTPWGLFPALGDDEWITVTVRSDEDWAALCGAIARPDLLADPELSDVSGRAAQRTRINVAVAEWTARRSPDDAMNRLQIAGVPAGAMLRAAEVASWGYCRQRGSFREERHPLAAGPWTSENTQIHADGIAAPPRVPAPLLGEQTREIAADLLGLDAARIEDLIRRGVLTTAPATAPVK